jgi:alpha-tubulin suppressor-like RCC1 family protein
LAFASVSAGAAHTCGITTSGAAYCWGSNDHGQLGEGAPSSTGPTGGGGGALRTAPAAVAGALRFTSISAGLDHTCAVSVDGAAYCWGSDHQGQLGDGGATPDDAQGVAVGQPEPVPVAGGVRFTAVSAGSGFTCGLATTRAIHCWGRNASGQLGDGTTLDRASPAPVAGSQTFLAVSSGGSHACGLVRTASVQCWGSNAHGELGDGSTARSLVPVTAKGTVFFGSLDVGGEHTCAVTVLGATYCWGASGLTNPVDGTTPPMNSAPVFASSGFVKVNAGAGHTAGLTSGGLIFGWGRNESGNLGDGTQSNVRSKPVRVLGGTIFVAVSAGASHTCGLTAAGAVHCWGANSRGQLGDGTTTRRLTPVRIVQ